MTSPGARCHLLLLSALLWYSGETVPSGRIFQNLETESEGREVVSLSPSSSSAVPRSLGCDHPTLWRFQKPLRVFLSSGPLSSKSICLECPSLGCCHHWLLLALKPSQIIPLISWSPPPTPYCFPSWHLYPATLLSMCSLCVHPTST